MTTLWLLLELANLIVFTLVILPRKQPVNARPLLPVTATRLLRLTFLIPILVFGYSLFFSHQIGPVEWGCLILAIVGNALVIKGKWDLGESHTWTGYYLPRAKKGYARHFCLDCAPHVYRNYSGDYLVQPGLHYPTTHMAKRTGADLLFLHRRIFDYGGPA